MLSVKTGSYRHKFQPKPFYETHDCNELNHLHNAKLFAVITIIEIEKFLGISSLVVQKDHRKVCNCIRRKHFLSKLRNEKTSFSVPKNDKIEWISCIKVTDVVLNFCKFITWKNYLITISIMFL